MPEDLMDDSIGDRLLHDDEDAWNKVLTEIMPRAKAAIRRRFGGDQRYLGADDVVDSAVRSFIRQLKAGAIVKDLNSWDDLLGWLVKVAYRKRIDVQRKADAATKREQIYQDDKERNLVAVKHSVVLEQLFLEDDERVMDEAMKQVVDALKTWTEFLVFQGKLDQQSDREIAKRVEEETGERMTEFMVKKTWPAIRARLHRILPDLPDLLRH